MLRVDRSSVDQLASACASIGSCSPMARHCSDQSIGSSVRRLTLNPARKPTLVRGFRQDRGHEREGTASSGSSDRAGQGEGCAERDPAGCSRPSEARLRRKAANPIADGDERQRRADHYAPKEPLGRLDAVLIATAKTSIYRASYALTDRIEIDALTAAKNRGVRDTNRFAPSEPRNKIVLTQTLGQTPSFQMAGSIDEAIVARATHKRRGDIHRVQPEPFAAGSDDNAFVIAVPVTN